MSAQDTGKLASRLTYSPSRKADRVFVTMSSKSKKTRRGGWRECRAICTVNIGVALVLPFRGCLGNRTITKKKVERRRRAEVTSNDTV